MALHLSGPEKETGLGATCRPGNTRGVLGRDFLEAPDGPGGVGGGIAGDMEYGPLADGHAGKAAKIDPAVCKGFRQRRSQAGFVGGGDLDSAEGFAFVESHLFGGFGLAGPLDGCDKRHGLAAFGGCAAGQEEMQVGARLGQTPEFFGQFARLIGEADDPDIHSFHVHFHVRFSPMDFGLIGGAARMMNDCMHGNGSASRESQDSELNPARGLRGPLKLEIFDLRSLDIARDKFSIWNGVSLHGRENIHTLDGCASAGCRIKSGMTGNESPT
jgi:hypothetical protein